MGDVVLENYGVLSELMFEEGPLLQEKLRFMTVLVFKFATVFVLTSFCYSFSNARVVTHLFDTQSFVFVFMLPLFLASLCVGAVQRFDHFSACLLRVFPVLYPFMKQRTANWMKTYFCESFLAAILETFALVFLTWNQLFFYSDDLISAQRFYGFVLGIVVLVPSALIRLLPGAPRSAIALFLAVLAMIIVPAFDFEDGQLFGGAVQENNNSDVQQ